MKNNKKGINKMIKYDDEILEPENLSITLSKKEQYGIVSSDYEEVEKNNEDLLKNLTPAIEQLNKKYGEKYSVTTMSEAIRFIAMATKEEKELKRLVDAELLNGVVEATIFKAILVNAFVINSQLNAIQNRAFTECLANESVSIVEKIFLWIENLEKIKEKYAILDIEKRISEIKENNSGRKDNNEQRELIRMLTESLKQG